MATEGAGPGRSGRDGARQLLLSSPLFDEEWYALRTGVEGDRAALVEHYLATPVPGRTSPHPLFDPAWFREQSGLDLGGKDPFLVYLRRRAFGTPTHPAFSTVHYRRTVEGAKEHPHGPLGHYAEVGAPAGIPGNRFLPLDPDGRGSDLRAWHLARHRALASPPSPPVALTPSPSVVTVVVPVPVAPRAWHQAWQTVTPLVAEGAPQGRRLQVVVLDLGAGDDDAVKLDVLALRHPEVEVVHPAPGETPRSVAAALASVVPWVAGTSVVVVDHAVDVRPGWLAPLVAVLQDGAEDGVADGAEDSAADGAEVGAVQPLVLAPDGTVASAGVLLTDHGAPDGPGHPFLAGLPVEDAAGVDRLDLPALGGACVALRTTDLAALRGDDALLLLPGRPRRLAVVPSSVVVHRAPGEGPRVALPPLGAGRTCSPSEVAALWRTHGFEVALPDADPDPDRDRGPDAVPVVRRARTEVVEAAPRLRWALKNPAPVGPDGEKWGDTHFAAALAAALREVGQEVVVDRREAFDRESGRHDDVHLLLRGLVDWRPPAHAVSLAWVISHPEDVEPAALRAYDRVLAASVTWAHEQSVRWGVRVEPLLQATDPRLFHPDRAEPDSGERVLFVGSSRGEYRPMVRAAVEQGLPLALHGTGWEELVPATVLRGTFVPNAELGAAYRSAGVVLNDHWEDMRRDGFLSNRLFDAVASGARVLTDDVAGLGDLFARSVQVVRTPQELVHLASLPDPDAVFGDDAERRSVAARVGREHSFTARARRLVEVAAEAVRQRAPR